VWHGEPLQERVGIRGSNQRRHIDGSDNVRFVLGKYIIDCPDFPAGLMEVKIEAFGSL
jgi:hypothetical protein